MLLEASRMSAGKDKIAFTVKPAGLPVPAQRLSARKGQSVAEIIAENYGSEDGIRVWVKSASPLVQWEPVPPAKWRFMRPRRDDILQFSYLPHGGKNANLFATVAAIALAVLAPGIGSAIATGLGFAATGFAASLITAGIVFGGSLLLNKLFPADLGSGFADRDANESGRFDDVSSDSNILAREAYLPVVIDRRISPPDLMEPRPRMLAGARAIDRCLGLYGEHLISDIRNDGTPIDDMEDVTVETKDGSEDEGCYTFINEISVTTGVGESLPTFALDGATLEDQVTASNAEPRWIHFSTPGHPDLEEVVIRIRIDAFVKTDSATQKQRVPIRIQVRPKGNPTWVNLPEIHLKGRDPTTTVKDFRFRWDDLWGGVDSPGDITYDFWCEVPAVTAHSLSDGSQNVTQWQSNAWFDAGAGYQQTANIFGQRSGLRVRLNESVVAKGDLEWRIMRGYATNDTALDADYKISSVVESLFVAKGSAGTYTIAVDQGAFVSSLTVEHATAIADRYPVEWPQTAIIALRSKQTLRNITCYASRKVLDWNGSAWATETTSSTNPATHYRQFLADFCAEHGYSTSLIDSAAFVAWRAECAARGYACAAVFAGDTMAEILSALATAGFAREIFGTTFSIEYFRDRSADPVVQLFSPRNSGSIKFSIDTPQRPFGLRISYPDGDDDDRTNEMEVTIDNAADIGLWEKTTYKAIKDPELVRRRGVFDLLQTNERRRKWLVETSLEGVLCQPGDLVGVVTDLFDDKSQGARVRQVINGSTLVIDQAILAEDYVGSFAENPSVANMLTVGDKSIIFVHTPTGVEERDIIEMDGNVVVLDAPLQDGIGNDLTDADLKGTIVSITTLSAAVNRCFVLEVKRTEDLRASITLVDEAPQIWNTMERLFP